MVRCLLSKLSKVKGMVTIKKINARQILDSRGNPTVEARIWSSRAYGVAKVPSGASTGIHEALELRDNNKAYGGKSVLKAVRNINKTISSSLVGKSFTSQQKLDQFLIDLDATVNKAKLGENAILAVSMAFSRLLADSNKIPLYKQLAKEMCMFNNTSFSATKKFVIPVPFANVLNGGVHAGNDLEMQEFMIVPVGAQSFAQATQMIAETYHTLKHIIEKKYGKNATNVGDEGGFAPPLQKAEDALKLIVRAIKKSGYEGKIKIAMDTAASEFYKNKIYLNQGLSSQQLASYYESLLKKYPIISLEDPFDQDDFKAWQQFTEKNTKKLQIVGDDLTVTNPARVQLAVDMKLCNSLLLKVNQIGTISESITSAFIAKNNGWSVMVSHRSGETQDSFIADLAVGLGTGQIKLGAPCRSDRVAKYNRLLEIEEDLGKRATYFTW